MRTAVLMTLEGNLVQIPNGTVYIGTSTVNLRVYFWLNGRTRSWLKVRSSVIRLVKRDFQRLGISISDAARSGVPNGVPVTMVEAISASGVQSPSP